MYGGYPPPPERNDWLEPDAPPKAVGYCISCKRDIFPGDDIWEIRDEWYCESCIDEAHKEAEGSENTFWDFEDD